MAMALAMNSKLRVARMKRLATTIRMLRTTMARVQCLTSVEFVVVKALQMALVTATETLRLQVTIAMEFV
tara:strand:- start:73 stop:282 length:210 start_codon:yes stop_codon:yes gene_type:complete